MEYLSVAKTAEKWNISQRSVRNYCAEGRVPGAFLTGKTWNIPADAGKPDRIKRKDAAPAMLLGILKEERSAKRTDGMRDLLEEYNSGHVKTLHDLIEFHVRFERIYPFQDGNGRVGRLILFKECLKYGIVPFIIEDDWKLFYYRGLKEWGHENGYLTDTFLTAQDRFKKYLDYFRIRY